MTPQEKARLEHEQKKAQEKPQPKAALPQPGLPPKGQSQSGPPPVEHKAVMPPVEHKAVMPPVEHKAATPPVEHKAATPPIPPPAGTPKGGPAMTPPTGLPEHKALTTPPGHGAPPAGHPAAALPGNAPAGMQKPPLASTTSSARVPSTQFHLPPHPAGGPAPKLEELQKVRHTRVEDGGRRTVIEEPGNRTIIRQDNRLVIRHDDGERFRLLGGANVHTEKRPDGHVETFFVRPDGVRIVSVVDANGRLIRRYRRELDGRERNIIDNRRFWGAAGAIGVGALAIGVLLSLPPPVITLPPERYIVAFDRASDDDLYEALSAEPLEHLDRAYSLEEIRDNYALRQRLRRIDVDAIHFASGSWQVPEEQYPGLERIANIMLRLLDRNPDEVFLIAAYTDAVGSDVDNLSLSDRRAQSVAEILTVNFGVPPENLVTQGYGAQFLLIDTPAPEPRNRRVEIQRITPLMAER
jgi:outer membrane protein OmpA-like peptidoglycan-associated protein